MKHAFQWAARQFDFDWISWLCVFVAVFTISDGAFAQAAKPTPHYTLWTTTYCHSWGDSLGWRWTQCETPVRVVENKTERTIERVIERPVPAPVVVPPPAPAPKPRING